MIKDITIGQYFQGDSLLHRSDPRVKILLTLVFLIVAFTVNTYIALGILLIFTGAIIKGSKISIRYALKGLRPVFFILVITSLFNIFTVEGTVIWKYGYLRVTMEGIEASIKLILRISIMITGSSLLTFTTTPIALTDGMEKLLSPLKRIRLPVHEIAMMMTIAIRFIPTLLEETEKIMKAQASRGADFESGNIVKRAKSFIPVLIPLFVSAFRRADDLAVAMEARCYRGDIGRTRMKQLKLGWPDLISSAILIVFVLGIAVLNAFL
ncbi:MAG: energy-coupling factor transporter transmembrane protein EcfT [Clostridia bacterium]|nr:energy-coupling factor transporter transmembrane protein EcfT [Clostridia bacterium]